MEWITYMILWVWCNGDQNGEQMQQPHYETYNDYESSFKNTNFVFQICNVIKIKNW